MYKHKEGRSIETNALLYAYLSLATNLASGAIRARNN